MIGSFLLDDRGLTLSRKHSMKLAKDAHGAFAAGIYSIDDHGPVFDTVLVEASAGIVPSHDELTFMIRDEIRRYGREARYRKQADELREWAWENLQDAGYVRIPFLLTTDQGLLLGEPGGEHGDIKPFGAMGKQGEVYFYSHYPPQVHMPMDGPWQEWSEDDIKLLKQQILESALEKVQEFEGEIHFSATSEDTEPVGKNVGFLREPHDTLYPPLFRGGTKIPQDAITKLKDHVLVPLSKELPNADQFIYFTIYGSGVSYNWDEAGDMDIQMWIDIEKYDGEPMSSDDLVAAVRRVVQPINFPSFEDLDLTVTDEGIENSMLVQYYPKPGKGTPEENLASKPYACYDLETGEWLQEPILLHPTMYGEHFLMIEPKCEDIALQAEALLGELDRNVLNWQFWYAMYERYGNPHYQERYIEAQENGTQEHAGIVALFEGVFGGRAEAYSPEGKGVEDERDMVQKLLEVWGVFQKLKHAARAPLPWEETELPKAASSDDAYTHILNNGGGTYTTDLTPATHRDGYYIALKGMEKVIPLAEFTADYLEEYAAHTTTNFVGAWISDGLVYLDNTIWEPNQAKAMLIGEQNEQQAIWDIANMQEIWLNKAAGWKVSDYNGWTNWETWNVKLMIDNNGGMEWVDKARELAQQGTEPLRDWTIFNVIAPYNQETMAGAQEWNDVPEHERLDPQFEDLRNRNEQAADIVNQLGFGPNTQDATPDLIDPEMVNWDEIVANILDELEEERRYEQGLPPSWEVKPDMDAPGDFTLPQGWSRVAAWADVQADAAEVLPTVQLLRNGLENVVSQVPSQTREGMMYPVELWPSRRQEMVDSGNPNYPLALWSCECEWGQHSWGRTRQFKKFEGRPCKHVLATYWASLSQPVDDIQAPIPGMEDALRATVPGQPPTGPLIPTAPTPPEPPMSELTTDVPSAPFGDLNQDQLAIPGVFSSWRKAGMFMNGDYVRTNVKVDGYDEDGIYYVVPRNMIGEVLWADDEESVVIFSIESKALGPHNVKVTAPSSNFSLVPRQKGTAPRRHR